MSTLKADKYTIHRKQIKLLKNNFFSSGLVLTQDDRDRLQNSLNLIFEQPYGSRLVFSICIFN